VKHFEAKNRIKARLQGDYWGILLNIIKLIFGSLSFDN
jgi:hypothetical protein